MKSTKCIATFDNDHELQFIHYVQRALHKNGLVTFYEAYDENKSEIWGYTKNDNNIIVFLSDKFCLESILNGLLHTYGADINITLEYDEDNPIVVDEISGEEVYQKYLQVYLA